MEDPPQESRSLDEWQQDDFMIITWLQNSMEPYASVNFMFLETGKQIQDAVKEAYSLKKKIFRESINCMEIFLGQSKMENH